MNPDPLDPKLFPWSGSEIIFFSNPDQNASSLCINCSENTVECSFKVRIREATLGIVKICLAEHFASDKIQLFLIISGQEKWKGKTVRRCRDNPLGCVQVHVANSFGQIASATIMDDVTNLILGKQCIVTSHTVYYSPPGRKPDDDWNGIFA